MRPEDDRLRLASLLLAAPIGACATAGFTGPLPFYASWDQEETATKPLFVTVDCALRKEPSLSRSFDDAMNVHLSGGTPGPDGQWTIKVRIALPEKFERRRIKPASRVLADFKVSCALDQPQPCANKIVQRVLSETTRISRIVRRSPKA